MDVIAAPNNVRKGEGEDYIAEVLPPGEALRNEDVARLIVKERTEFHYETLLGILNLNDDIKRRKLADGFSVLDGVGHRRFLSIEGGSRYRLSEAVGDSH